jgi:long-chain acyl-CoA synthetase
MYLNLGSILLAQANEQPDAVVIRAGDAVITYAELDRAARGVATSLRQRGVEPGDKVALLVPNVAEFTIAYFGILYAGATVVPINVLAAAPEVTYFLEDSGARTLVVHPLFEAPGREGAAPVGADVILAIPGEAKDTIGSLALAPPCDEPHKTSPQDTAVILYTSGTTGKPKGAELTHSNLLMNCAVVVPRLTPAVPEDGAHRALATLPLFHSFGQTVIQNGMIATGGSFTLLPRFDAEQAFELIERDRLTLFAGVPTMYFALLHHQGDRAYDISSLKGCMTGGAPMPVEVLNAFEEKFDVMIQEGFGLSETSPVASFNVPGKPRKTGSIGYPVWGVEMCIVDAEDNALPDEEHGEICIRGHNIMKGYLNRPDATAETLKNGWFHSGDIGYRDGDGCYFIVDRKKDMILRGGFNVYPREVEEVLYEHEAVAEAAVIGIPHESHGEEVKAFVSLAPGARSTPEELQAFCKDRLAAYKYPRIVEIIDSLPKGPTGKILKRELRD